MTTNLDAHTIHLVAVHHGIERLDKFGPADWRDRFGTRPIEANDFFSVTLCVLGRIFDPSQVGCVGYAVGMKALKLDPDNGDAVAFGFAPGHSGNARVLAEVWNQELGLQ